MLFVRCHFDTAVVATNLGELWPWPLCPLLAWWLELGGGAQGWQLKDFVSCFRWTDGGPEAQVTVPAGPPNCWVTLGKSLYLSGLQIPHCQMKESDWSMVQVLPQKPLGSAERRLEAGQAPLAPTSSLPFPAYLLLFSKQLLPRPTPGSSNTPCHLPILPVTLVSQGNLGGRNLRGLS